MIWKEEKMKPVAIVREPHFSIYKETVTLHAFSFPYREQNFAAIAYRTDCSQC